MPDLSSKPACGAAILAGGLNTRMNGRNKAFLKIGNDTILDRLLSVLNPNFEEILLVTRQPDLYSGQPVRVVQDIYEDRSSLTGMHAGLVYAKAEFVFMVPCDIPFLKLDIVRLLIDEMEPAVDVVIPFYGGHYQPLCAIYSKRCIPVIEQQLKESNYKIYDGLCHMNVKTVSEEKLKTVDPELISFLNINTPEAYDICRNFMAE